MRQVSGPDAGRHRVIIILNPPAAVTARSDQEVPLPETYEIGAPEPKPIDEELSVKLGHLAEDAILRGKPNGDERCDNCVFYLDTDKDITYCWHPKLRVLVGNSWWC